MQLNLLPARLLEYSDSGFTNPHELLLAQKPENRQGKYSHMGAQYSGFETARHRDTKVNLEKACYQFLPGNDNWLTIGFLQPSLVRRVEISTRWFTGNQVPYVSVYLVDTSRVYTETPILVYQSLEPDAVAVFEFPAVRATQVKIVCHSEGGLSRVHFYGESEEAVSQKNLLETAEIIAVSNQHYGKVSWAVQGSREQSHMVGWETARSSLGEYALFRLQSAARIRQLIVDTYLHRLNAPLGCHLFGAVLDSDPLQVPLPEWQVKVDAHTILQGEAFESFIRNKRRNSLVASDSILIRLATPENSPWIPLLDFGPLKADAYNSFECQMADSFTHLLFMIYPNGGIHGLKVYGEEGQVQS